MELLSVDAVRVVDLVRVLLWLVAGGISFYFSVGSSRIWTSIALGFFLIFVNEAYTLDPWAEQHRLAALHSVVGTIAILVMTHGFQEYYVFTRTLETGGSKAAVFLTVGGIVVASGVFLLINPSPTPEVLRNMRMIENTCWVFLSLINIDMIRKIALQVRDSALFSGFVAFGVTFALIFLWRGSALYLQVYGWDSDAAGVLVARPDLTTVGGRVALSQGFHLVSGILASLGVGGTFAHVYRLLR
jgi:hypothetical protein